MEMDTIRRMTDDERKIFADQCVDNAQAAPNEWFGPFDGNQVLFDGEDFTIGFEGDVEEIGSSESAKRILLSSWA